MTAHPDFTFRMKPINWKSQNLVYEEPGHTLIVYLEVSGVDEFDWLGTDSGFGKWTVPKNQVIPESKRQEILQRLAEWGQANHLRIDISPPVNMEKMYADYQKRGGTVEHKADGSTLLTPPSPQNWLERILRMLTS